MLATSGLYERSGDWLYDVGLPGKSGVSGGMVTVSPGKGGVGTYSPPLDDAGNSVRGQRITTYLSERWVSTSSPRPRWARPPAHPLPSSEKKKKKDSPSSSLSLHPPSGGLTSPFHK